MVRYRFAKWEDGSTSPSRSVVVGTVDLTIMATYAVITHRVTFQSQPVGVQATINGQPVNTGQGIDIPEGTTITVVVPGEVSG